MCFGFWGWDGWRRKIDEQTIPNVVIETNAIYYITSTLIRYRTTLYHTTKCPQHVPKNNTPITLLPTTVPLAPPRPPITTHAAVEVEGVIAVIVVVVYQRWTQTYQYVPNWNTRTAMALWVADLPRQVPSVLSHTAEDTSVTHPSNGSKTTFKTSFDCDKINTWSMQWFVC